jgi:GDP-L-fucose synthase
MLMTPQSKIYVAGHRGLVGSAIVRALQAAGHQNLILKTSQELDLRDTKAVNQFFLQHQPEFVFLAAAKVGGILANRDSPVEFLYDNLMIEMNAIRAAAEYSVKKLLFLGSSCIYPKFAAQPLQESSLLTGALEPTNEAYAIAKIAGLKLCEYYTREQGKNFISVMPPNMYGPGDNFHPDQSHVIPGLIRRFEEARKLNLPSVKVWGTGKPLREFLFVDDLADACLFLMNHFSDPVFINAGSGQEVSIAELAQVIQRAVGYTGKIEWDSAQPDGTPRKIMDSSRIRDLGWTAKKTLVDGITQTVRWYRGQS